MDLRRRGRVGEDCHDLPKRSDSRPLALASEPEHRLLLPQYDVGGVERLVQHDGRDVVPLLTLELRPGHEEGDVKE